MENTPPLILGYIPYLNCVPFFAALREQGFDGELITGVPSALNDMLQSGELHASPSSSFEYARNWRDYLLLPGHSISSVGPVKSVLLFSPNPPQDLNKVPIAITGESATSINLLRVLLRVYYHHPTVNDYVPQGAVEDLIRQHRPALLIGDRALKMATTVPVGMQIYDLGELWHQHTGLPFVFALWMIRCSALKQYEQQLSQLVTQLQASRDHVLQQPDQYAAQAAQQTGLSFEHIIEYWRTIDFGLDQQHIKGLRLFLQLCVECKLLDEMPELMFYQ